MFGKLLCRIGLHSYDRNGVYAGMACERFGCPANKYGTINIGERDVAFEMLRPHLDYINGTPWLLWNIIDVNLMPEQCRTVKQAEALIKIVEAHKRGEFEKIN